MSAILGLSLRLVVDRIEPPVAVVEWSGGAHSDLPLQLLPRDICEGSALRIWFLPASKGWLAAHADTTFLSTPWGMLSVPSTQLRPGRRYRVHVQQPGARLPWRSPS